MEKTFRNVARLQLSLDEIASDADKATLKTLVTQLVNDAYSEGYAHGVAEQKKQTKKNMVSLCNIANGKTRRARQ